MTTTSKRRWGYAPLFLVSGALAACGASPAQQSVEETARASEPLLGGIVTNLRPEIGKMGGCTGTLISPRHFLSAAHCVAFSESVGVQTSPIQLTDASGVVHVYAVDRIHVFSGHHGNSSVLESDGELVSVPADASGTVDVALLHLSTAVPASVAVPAALSPIPPALGAAVTAFGYGCRHEGVPDGGVKQYEQFVYGTPSRHGCPGDSGGPEVLGIPTGGGAVWGVSSFGSSTTDDGFGSVTHFKEDIAKVMIAWDGNSLDVGFARKGSEYATQSNSSLTLCRQTCQAATQCRAFTFDSANSVCYLESAVPDWTACATCTSSKNLSTQTDATWAGTILSRTAQTGLEACRQACAVNARCAAYDYAATTSPNCTQLSSVTTSSTLRGHTSGLRRNIDSNTARAGVVTNTLSVASATACQSSCASDATCRAFNFTPTSGTTGPGSCQLMSTLAVPTLSARTSSGARHGLELNSMRAGPSSSDFTPQYAVAESCQAACAANPETCQSFTFVPDGFSYPVEAASAQAQPSSLLVSNGVVYWTNAGDGSIRSVPLQGGSITTLATAQRLTGSLAADRASLYWIDSGSVMRLPLGTSTPIRITNALPGTLSGGLAVVDDAAGGEGGPAPLTGHLYVTSAQGSSTSIFQGDLDGSNWRLMASGQSGVTKLVLDAFNMYWTNPSAGTVMQMPLDASSAPIALATRQNGPRGLLVAGPDAYWVNQADGSIATVSIGSPAGSVRTLITGQGTIGELTLDAVGLYWTTPVAGNLQFLPFDTSRPTLTLFSAQASPSGIVSDSGYLFWLTSGAVMKEVLNGAHCWLSNNTPAATPASDFVSGVRGLEFF